MDQFRPNRPSKIVSKVPEGDILLLFFLKNQNQNQNQNQRAFRSAAL